MKPWPQVLAERYPRRVGRQIDRPWWSLLRSGASLPAHGSGVTLKMFSLVRDDGACLLVDQIGRRAVFSPGMTQALPSPLLAPEEIDLDLWLAHADRVAPLPFPGIRVGQVWALVYATGEPSIFQITEYDADHEEEIGCTVEFVRCHGVHARPRGSRVVSELRSCDRERDGVVLRRRPWHAGGSWISEEEMLDLCRDGYLVADVACPHLAPWSPPEASNG